MIKDRITCRLPTSADINKKCIQHLVDLINAVYRVAEAELWTHNMRTTPETIQELLEKKGIILAEMNNNIVGSIQVTLIDDNICEAGMLVADLELRKIGIGSALAKAAQDYARTMKCQFIQLKLLTPRHWVHPGKEDLKKWYLREGFAPTVTEAFEIAYPELAERLATECDCTTWRKRL